MRGWHASRLVGGLSTWTAILVATQALAAGSAATVSVHATPTEITYRGHTRLTGKVSVGALPRANDVIELQSSRAPFRRFVDVAHVLSGRDGSFTFASARLDLNTRFRAKDLSLGANSRPIDVFVDAKATLRARSRGPGRVLLTVVTEHAPSVNWRHVRVWWFVAVPGSHTWLFAAQTATSDLRPGVTLAGAIVDPPSRRFAFKACFNPPGERSMGPPSSHSRCPTRDYTVGHRVR